MNNVTKVARTTGGEEEPTKPEAVAEHDLK